MITRINESGLLIKHISRDCKCKFDGSKHNLNQKWNKPKCKCEFKNPINHCLCQKDYVGIVVYVLMRVMNI